VYGVPSGQIPSCSYPALQLLHLISITHTVLRAQGRSSFLPAEFIFAYGRESKRMPRKYLPNAGNRKTDCTHASHCRLRTYNQETLCFIRFQPFVEATSRKVLPYDGRLWMIHPIPFRIRLVKPSTTICTARKRETWLAVFVLLSSDRSLSAFVCTAKLWHCSLASKGVHSFAPFKARLYRWCSLRQFF